MDIRLSKKEYKLLLDMLYLADWMMHTYDVHDKKMPMDYGALRQTLLSYSPNMGVEDCIQYSKEKERYYETPDYKEELKRLFISPYNDEFFREELVRQLAQRDFLAEYEEKKHDKLDLEARINVFAQLMQRYEVEFAEHDLKRLRIQAEEEVKEPGAEALLKEVSALAQKIQGKAGFAINDFQKCFVIEKVDIEILLTELIKEGAPIKIILTSLFYGWFQLEASFYTHFESIDKEETFTHMLRIIDLVKDTVSVLPNPELSPGARALNKKMQALRRYLPVPESFDTVSSRQLEQETGKINVAINTFIRRSMRQKTHPETLANALFDCWLRFSVFLGVSESQWQKTEHYFVEILEEVKQYMHGLFNRSDERSS
jgi:hypothetical protein